MVVTRSSRGSGTPFNPLTTPLPPSPPRPTAPLASPLTVPLPPSPPRPPVPPPAFPMAAPAVPAVTTPWHDYLTGELGFSIDGATYIETDQGYTGLDSIKILVPKDIANLADTMKKKRAGTAIDVSQGAERGLLYTLGYVR